MRQMTITFVLWILRSVHCLMIDFYFNSLLFFLSLFFLSYISCPYQHFFFMKSTQCQFRSIFQFFTKLLKIIDFFCMTRRCATLIGQCELILGHSINATFFIYVHYLFCHILLSEWADLERIKTWSDFILLMNIMKCFIKTSNYDLCYDFLYAFRCNLL